MNPQIIHRSTSIARKEYDDDGWDFIQNCEEFSPDKKLIFAEKRMIVKYKQKVSRPHKILKGDIYERQFNTYEGKPYVWRTKKVFYDLICKYDLFPEL